MKRKMATLRYLLYGILFLPAAYLLCGVIVWAFSVGVTARDERAFAAIVISAHVLAGVALAIMAGLTDDSEDYAVVLIASMFFAPFLGVDAFNDLLGVGLVASYIILFALMFGGLMIGGFVQQIVEEAHGPIYDKLDGVSVAALLCLSLALADILNFAYLSVLLFGNAEGVELVDRIDLAVVERLNAFAALAGLVMFVVLAWRDYHENLLDFCQYPADREIIARLALNDERWYVRKKAVELLPYPQEREILLRIARNDSFDYVRSAAANLLPYPEEREIIERIAQNDDKKWLRETAREKIKAWEEKNKAAREETDGGGAS